MRLKTSCQWLCSLPSLGASPLSVFRIKEGFSLINSLVFMKASKTSDPLIIALWNKSNGSYDIKDLGTLPLISYTSKYFRWKFQPCPSFFSHANIPDKRKRGQLSLEQMMKKEKVKVKSQIRYLAACSIQKMG